MYMIIVGAGSIGASLIDLSVKEKNNVVVIDSNPERGRDISTRYDVTVLTGNATSAETLREAMSETQGMDRGGRTQLMEITFHEVTVDSEDLQSTIESLEAANARNLRIKALYEEILRVQGGGARSSSISPWRTGLGVRVARARNAKTLAETITDVKSAALLTEL